MQLRRSHAIRLENYLPLIAKIVRSYYRSLPESKKAWITVDDMIHDVIITVKTDLVRHFDPDKAKFTTILTIFTERWCMNFLKSHRRRKRDEGFAIPLDDLQYLLVGPSFQIDEGEKNQLVGVYRAASPRLKTYMLQWFFSGEPIRLYKGSRSREAIKELLKLCTIFNVNAETCRRFFVQKEQGKFTGGYEHRISISLK